MTVVNTCSTVAPSAQHKFIQVLAFAYSNSVVTENRVFGQSNIVGRKMKIETLFSNI